MACRACWLNDLNKLPCIDAHGCEYDVNIPATVTLHCYAVMTKTWARPGGKITLISMIDGIPVTRNILTKSKPMRSSIAYNLSSLTEDLGELRELATLAAEVLPKVIPWFPGCQRRRVIELERTLKIQHAPFVIDDGRGRARYQEDVARVKKHGPALRVSTWGEWFNLREGKEQQPNGQRKKSNRRS